MSALIWDSTAQAFKDADTPNINNENSFGDAEGKIWNETAQAWEDAWSSWKGVLYDYGNECTSITGGWTIVRNNSGQARKDTDYLFFPFTGQNTNVSAKDDIISTVNKVDISGYKNAYIVADINNGYANESLQINANSRTNGTKLGEWILYNDTSETLNNLTVVGTENGHTIYKTSDFSYSGSYYVLFYCFGKGGKFYKLWLE